MSPGGGVFAVYLVRQHGADGPDCRSMSADPAGGLTNKQLRALLLAPAPAAAVDEPQQRRQRTAGDPVPAPSTTVVEAPPTCVRCELVSEGSARLHTEGTFFNPKSLLQRDLTVLALRQWLQQRQQPAALLDAMAGSGVRALRYLLEVPQVGVAVANDSSAAAVAAVRSNAELSGLQPDADGRYLADAARGSLLEASQQDASAYMREHAGRFDVVELDPCGSVGELLPAAVRCLKPGGLLVATATDLGSLAGRFGDNCSARYGSQPVRSGAKLAPELAMRILLACAARAAGAAGRRVVPLLCVTFADFFVRVIVEVVEEHEEAGEGAGEAEGASEAARAEERDGFGLAIVCAECGAAEAQPLGRPQQVCVACEQCGGCEREAGGPIWLGRTADLAFVAAMLAALPCPASAGVAVTAAQAHSGAGAGRCATRTSCP